MSKRFCIVVALASLSVLASAKQQITVFAAASLKETFQELGRLYESRHPGSKITFQFAGSQQLAAQIKQGAPADMFASADEPQMVVAVGGKGTEFARNKLVLVVSRPSSGKVLTVRDLSLPGIKFVVGVRNVPVGLYTSHVLEGIARQAEHGWAQRVAGNIVSRETDVRAILAKVQLGEADAGIVYVTDARSAKAQVVTRPIPDSVNVSASYRVSTLKNSAAGESFKQLLLSQDGRRVLSVHGFILPAK